MAVFAPLAALGQNWGERCGDELPVAVAEMRDKILAAAKGGSVEELAALADPELFTSNYGGEETLAYWRALEAEGVDIGGIARALLALDCVPSATEEYVLYTWPPAADLPYSALTDEERAAIGALHGGAIEDVYVEGPEIGYYAGWQLIIAGSGRWFALVAGD